jgi:hypothetical protein
MMFMLMMMMLLILDAGFFLSSLLLLLLLLLAVEPLFAIIPIMITFIVRLLSLLESEGGCVWRL